MAVSGVFIGLATLDVAQHVAELPRRNEKATLSAAFVSAGGPAANAAVTFSALGGRARLVTGLGPGPLAHLARADLESRGVEVIDLASDDQSFATPLSTIWVSANGERTIAGSDASGNPALTPPAALADWAADADVLLVDGHHPLVASCAVGHARDVGLPVVVDVGRWKPVFEELVGPGAHAVCSEGARPPGGEDLAAYLFERGATAVVVTAGGGPVRVWPAGVDAAAPTGGPRQPVSVEVPRVSAVDTLGAGDAFHGAYAYAVARGESVMAATRRGIEVASLRVQHRGPRSWLPHLPG